MHAPPGRGCFSFSASVSLTAQELGSGMGFYSSKGRDTILLWFSSEAEGWPEVLPCEPHRNRNG